MCWQFDGVPQYADEDDTPPVCGPLTRRTKQEEGPAAPVMRLSMGKVRVVSSRATSVGNFAVLCMREMFTVNERKEGNVAGSKGRSPLDPTGHRLSQIYAYAIDVYKVSDADRMKALKICQCAMDQANRNLRKITTRKSHPLQHDTENSGERDPSN